MSFEKNAVDAGRIPEHIAIIMDGNGRWARRRLRPRSFGHRAGMEALRRAVQTCGELGVRVLTVYAFSTENWKRPQEEISFLMGLLQEYLGRELQELHRQGVVVRVLGDISPLDPRIQAELRQAQALTAGNRGLVLNIALNYGGRREL
ncbi:MAG: polyprenyl diphosphate synthase, partial [Syntrophomonadaceae bacterium]|nr:polyprenyl diphosphate synthase [Syntrophomonadaceae bacterium]